MLILAITMQAIVVTKWVKCSLVAVLGLFLQMGAAHSITLDELRADSKLTPARFIEYFSDFKFQLRDQVQAPETFLASKTGDCDDFASLATLLLREKGYTTRLVVVSMDRETHVVCYVAETKSYLDFNNRSERKLVDSDGALNDIADKVAAGFRCSWHSVSEFTFSQGAPRFLSTQFR
jgi:hypothetical protein